ncbi:DinB family protein [Patescibacteria group bacterium]
MNIQKKKFLSCIKALSDENWNLMVTDKWSVKDVVAHMIGWEKEDPEAIRLTWKTKQKPWFKKTDDYADFNKSAVDFYKSYRPTELIAELEKWQKRVQETIDQIGEENLRDYPDLFDWLFDESEDSHYADHLKQIKFLSETTPHNNA